MSELTRQEARNLILEQGTDIRIPDHITSIPINQFYGKGLTSVYIPDGVTSIGDFAFAANNITEIRLPSSLRRMGRQIFQDNNIEAVELPEGMESIGNQMFRRNNITELVLPSSMREVGAYAFEDNPISNLQLNDGLEHLRIGAFASTEMFSVVIPESVLSLGEALFAGSQLSTIEFSENTTISEFPSSLFGNTNLRAISIPDSVTSIGRSVFSSTDLRRINIPDSVTYIGGFAFHDTPLRQIRLPRNLREITPFMLADTNLRSITLPDTIVAIREGAFSRSKLSSISIPEGVMEIGSMAFFVIEELQEVEMPGSILSIGSRAFWLTSIEEISLPPITNYIHDSFDEAIEITIIGKPFDINISNSYFAENTPIQSTITSLVTADPDIGDTHTYSFVEGDGDNDNHLFAIDGNLIKTNSEFDHEERGSYSIRVETMDSQGQAYQKPFQINVVDIFEENEQLGVFQPEQRPNNCVPYPEEEWMTLGLDVPSMVATHEGKTYVLARGTGCNAGMYRVWTFNEDGVRERYVDRNDPYTDWAYGELLVFRGYEEIFQTDFDQDGELRGVRRNESNDYYLVTDILSDPVDSPEIDEEVEPDEAAEIEADEGAEPYVYELPITENHIKGFSMNDILEGTIQSDLITGQKGKDKASGDRGNDVLVGGQGKDKLYGEIGEDYLDGSKGNDLLVGGAGADVFQLSKGTDIVRDFSIREGDRIALTNNGRYRIINDPEGVLVSANGNRRMLLQGLDYDEIVQVGIELFVQPV